MPEPAPDLRRQLSWLDTSAIYVGIILGSGIFVAPALVASATDNPWAGAGLWVIGGVVAACGAFCYAECGARLPHTGGFYVYYREAYGEPVAFIGGWAALLISYPLSLAAIAWVQARYLAELVPLGGDTWVPIYAGAGILVSALLNGVRVRAGTMAQRVLTTTKVTALALLCLAALVAPAGGPPSFAAVGVAPSAGLALVMAVLLWTYDGWSDVTLVGGELREPGRDLGRTVLIGTTVLVGLYVLVQLAVMVLLGGAAASSKQVVSDAVGAGLGASTAKAVALLVVVCTFGSLNGIVLTASRLGFAMARDGVFLRWFAVVDRRLGTPLRSLAVLASAALTYVVAAWLTRCDPEASESCGPRQDPFEELLTMFGFIIWIFYALTAVALLLLRRRRVGEPPAWRAPAGYVPPLVVLGTAWFMTSGLLAQSPERSLQGLALLLVGVPVYFIWRSIRIRIR